MNAAVFAVIIILALSALMGIKRGFIKTVFMLFSTIAAILLTVLLSPYVSKMMQNNDRILNYVMERVEQGIDFGDEETQEDSFIEGLGLPSFLEKALVENNNSDIYDTLEVERENIKHYVSLYVAIIIIKAIAFILTFIVLLLLLGLLCRVLDIVAKLPVLHGINKLLGCAAGIVQGIVIIWLLCVFLTAISGTALGRDIFEMIDESRFLTYIYDNNLIITFVTSVFKS